MLHPPFCRRQLTRFVASIYIYTPLTLLCPPLHSLDSTLLSQAARQPGKQAGRQSGKFAKGTGAKDHHQAFSQWRGEGRKLDGGRF